MDRASVLKMGMVGGGRGAMIGSVHRTAACMDGNVRFVAGALSSTPERALASGKELGLADGRNYATWRAMLEGELALPVAERIDFVSVVTPNHAHFEPARAFAAAGFNVVCDKPLAVSSREAEELVRTAEGAGVVFCVTYNYSGYPMVKQARRMIADGLLGPVRKMFVEYHQGWLATALEKTGQKQADWRTDPARAGLGGAIGDIGSHAEQLVSYVTGLEAGSLCADLAALVPGRALDDDAAVLLRFRERDGVMPRGVLTASQVCVGHENDLRLRVYGTKGGMEWHQEDPNYLSFRPIERPEQVYKRGNAYLSDEAKRASRLPAGHPEAFFEGFGNVYNEACNAMRARAAGKAFGPDVFDYPGVRDGARGVRFIEKTVENARGERKWTGL